MAVPPKFAAHRLYSPPADSVASSTSAVLPATHSLELYLDYCCPFSAKMWKTITADIIPLVQNNPRWASSLTLVFRHQVQPWHPSSTLMHEAALAVLRLAPAQFLGFSTALFAAQKDFFDVSVVHETRNQTYARLAKLAAASVGVDEAAVYDALVISDKPGEDGALNSGNRVTTDLKLVTRMSRTVGIHVSPTAVFNGIVIDVSSSWDGERWEKWLNDNVV